MGNMKLEFNIKLKTKEELPDYVAALPEFNIELLKMQVQLNTLMRTQIDKNQFDFEITSKIITKEEDINISEAFNDAIKD